MNITNTYPFTLQQIDSNVSITDIRKEVMDGRKMRVLPYSKWMEFSWSEIRLLLHKTATYVVPTTELLDYLDELIGDEKTIEICAGNGYIGSELDIVMTDSYQQRDDKFTVEYYKLMGQPCIKYPSSVIKMEASEAVRKMKPHTVLGCYATHKWDDKTQTGNVKGVDFTDIFNHVKRLILVGNLDTHKTNPLMAIPHKEIEIQGLLTRAVDSSRNRIFIWEH